MHITLISFKKTDFIAFNTSIIPSGIFTFEIWKLIPFKKVWWGGGYILNKCLIVSVKGRANSYQNQSKKQKQKTSKHRFQMMIQSHTKYWYN